ncbi:dihydrofolate reductase [Dehalogenimonas formicexedens]|uniref:Dihydrofolate reductase n=1 Tax=Dehalogenimonas formicexedens TaxID=1839801 RepID=A0A1P8F6G5_9CHLR|nr:dihydrofolate reductase family protein [Dehalogenimonas formicexedens]APV44030.1 dihydrofolate reductase [Dehalogenimonas formicexedens]
MRKIITTTFVTLDGVMQAPGGPTEDTTGGFAFGGWSANYWDSLMGEIMNGFMALPFEMLLGQTTYDIFAAYWPTAKADLVIAEKFNCTKKWVVSDKAVALSWQNSELITGDVVNQIKKLKTKDGPDLWVHGSGNLIQTLLKNHLIDRMYIWTFPVTVGGSGKRLFSDGTLAQDFKLIDSKTSTTGVIIATYEPRGELKTGTL